MKKFFLLPAVLFAFYAGAQKAHMPGKRGITLLINKDSVIQKLQQLHDSAQQAITENEKTTPGNSAGRFQPPADLKVADTRKQKREAFTRIAIGLGLFAILIIGLMRKRKKTTHKPG